ncbi:MAG TPA: molybdenum cofactor guanylyltransferase [Candidatus Cybelea sp.]|nr:molybdenum cofactor guanylyltransferase [Candidatus Cybelea sp.]
MDSVAIVLLAGGAASRFPGKLERRIDGRPMLARSFDRLRGSGHPIYVAAGGSFVPELDAELDAPLLVDRHPGCGPLHAFLDACALIRADRLFAVAADQPNVDAALIDRLSAAWSQGDEAVVPEHDGKIEPLAAAYDRRAALREGFELRASRKHAVRDLVARLRVHFVSCEREYFHNVNRPEDLP